MYSSLSEKEHQLLLDAIKDHAIFMLDANGEIISWNEGAKRMKGFGEEDVMGKHFRLLFRPEDQKEGRPENELKMAFEQGKFEDEWWRIKKDGSLFWAHVILQPVFDDHKQHIGFAKITRDITEKKRIHDLNTFLMNEVTGYAIFLLDKEGKVAKWSKAAENIIGFKEQEVVGKSLSILYLDNDGKDNEVEVEQHLSRARNDRYEEEGWKVRKDGSYFWANYVVTPLHNKDGYVVMIRNLTEKRSFEQELNANTALMASHKQLERFTSVISHELKEPIRKISTYSSILRADSPKQEILIDKIQSSCSRVTNLLDDIYKLSFITPDKSFEKQDLNIALQNALKSLDEVIRAKKALIRCKPLPNAPVIPGQMEQLMKNLISNSLKFCCPNNGTPEVDIEGVILPKESIEPRLLDTMMHSERYLQMKIQDNGIGFDNEHAVNIFDLFTRLHGSSEYEGTGVGLSICKRVAENHGGKIEAFSEKGKGALFVITLPVYEGS